MKKQFFIMTTIIAFLTVLMTVSVSAQSGETAKMNVEFDFYVGKTLYPAGEYVIESVSPTNDNVLRIRSAAGGGKSQMIISNMLNARLWQQPKIVFHRYDKNYFLSRIFIESGQWGFSLRSPQKERKYLASAKKVEVPLAK